MDQVTEYFSNFYARESLAVLTFMVISFLFGLLVGYLSRGRRIRRLEKELQERDQKILILERERDQLKEDLGLKEADLQKVQLEIQKRNAHIQQLDKEKSELRAELATAKDVVEQFKSANQTYSATIEDLNTQLAALQAENKRLKIALDKAEGSTDNLVQLQSTFNATNSRLQLLEEKLSQMEVDRERQTTEKANLANLENKLNLLADENQLLKKEIAIIKAIQNTRDDYEESKEDLATSRDLSNAEEDAIIVDEKEIIELSSEKSILREKINARSLLEKDDLTKIVGIGPFIEKKLNEIGVYTYEDISEWDENQIEQITQDIRYIPGRIQKDDWVGQAQRLLNAKRSEQETLASRAMATTSLDVRFRNLKIIEGIGPKIESLLKDSGIETVQDLASSKVADLKDILQGAGSKYRIHDPTTWPDQAKLAANEEWEKLKTYQDYLIGGREPQE